MKSYWLLAALALIGGQVITFTGRAQDTKADTNTVEIIKQLQRRIEELEEKVKALERSKTATDQENEARAKENETKVKEAETKAKENEAKQKEIEAKDKQQIEQLDQKVKVLERNRELDQEAAQTQAKEMPKITAGADGFGISSADGAFGLQFHGTLQVDSRTYFDDPINGNDGFLIRRARPILQGTVFRDFDFLFVPDFAPSTGPTIFDAYVNYRYNPALQLQAGKFKSPIGLEQLQSDVDILFNERALPTDLVPNRDVGFALHGDLYDGIASYTAAILTGVGDARNSSNVSFDDSKAYEGRLFFQPFRKTSVSAIQGFGFGVSGSYQDYHGTNLTGLPATTGGSLPGFFTDGQEQFFAYNPASNAVVVAEGVHWRLSPQGYYYWGPFGFLGEYVISDQQVGRTVTRPFTSAHLDNRGWEVSGSWILTGEDAAFRGGVVPRHAFNPIERRWGAVQLVARYQQLDVDDSAFPLFSNPNTSARSAAGWSVGLNWYLNRNIEFKTSFSQTHFEGGGGAGPSAPAAITRQDEKVFFTRIQLAF